MDQHYRPQPGTPVDELDTPCLILDMDSIDHNMDVMASYYAGQSSNLRPHSKNHKTPALAHRQIRRGGTVGGVCAAKVAEAEVMVHGGIPSVLVTSEIIAPLKIQRLCALARQAEMIVACDSLQNARDLSTAAAAAGVDLGVLIEIETQMNRCGVQDTEQGVALAQGVHSLPGLTFRGIMSHQMIPPMENREDRVTEGRRMIQTVIDLKDAIVATGIPVEIVSTGETWSYDVAGEIPGVTEVQGGSYLVMETKYSYMSDFHYAGKVLTTIISTPRPGIAVGDAGARAVGAIKGMPLVDSRPGVTVESMDADHAIFSLAEGVGLNIGDQLALIPGQQDAMVSRWDRLVGVRGGKVEAVWDIQARGCHS
jgi:D-serine deaminase-like pyridoxal phosphate-dependent protein